MLWRLAADGDEYESSKPFGSEHDEDEDVEHWQLVAQMRGHTADILDLAFSPCSRYIASASVDNNVVLWNCQQYTAMAVLRGHAGWVKGVSWDPCGRYVASYGDDQCVMVWDGRDEWKCKKRITDTFVTTADKDSGGKGIGRIGINEKMKQIVFARLSWSANGAYLAASRGYDGSKAIPVSPVFNRAGWKRTSVLVGHKHPTTVTRFNPRMFTRAAASVATELTVAMSGSLNGAAVKRRSARSHLSSQSLDAEASQPPFYPTYTVCAVGSLDNSISVWVTSSPTPLVHLDNFFTEAIVDLAWSADGYTLLACSHDGTVAVFSFTEDEFGRVLSAEEMKAHMRHEYGGEEAVGAGGGTAVVESIVGLELEEMGREYEERKRKALENKEEGRTNGVARVSSTAKLTSEELKASQKEGTKVDSKGRVRRVVAPVHIETSTVYSSSLPPVLLLPLGSAAADGAASHSASPSFTLLTSPSATSTLSAPVSTAAASQLLPTPSVSSSSMSPDPVAAKRKRDSEAGGQMLTKKKKPATTATAPPNTTSSIATATPGPSNVSSSATQPATASSPSPTAVSASPPAQSQLPARSRYCAEPAPMHKHLLCRLPPSSDGFSSAVSLSSTALESSMIESTPPASSTRLLLGSYSPRSFSTLVCRRAGAEQWQTVLPGHCTLLAANALVVVACCRDEREVDNTGTLHFLSRSGRRLLPPLHLSAPASFVTVCTVASSSPSSLSSATSSSLPLSTAFVLLLTSDGQLRLFDAVQLECVLELDVRSLLLSSPFSAARVLSDGRLLLVVKDGTCWLYEKRLKGWLNLADSDYVASDFKSTLSLASLGGAVQDAADRSLSSLQSEAQTAASAGGAQGRAPWLTLDARSRSMHTVAHIEVAPSITHTRITAIC